MGAGIDREKVHDFVKMFYRYNSKVFYVNSLDGWTVEDKPIGVFVSLGLTTSRDMIESIRDFLSKIKMYNVRIVELGSKLCGEDNYINFITDTKTPGQYKLTDLPNNLYNEESAKQELKRLKDEVNPNRDLSVITEYSPKVKRLESLISKLDETNGWDYHCIQNTDELDYKIFHLYINYKKSEGIEYRLGIFVEPAEKD